MQSRFPSTFMLLALLLVQSWAQAAAEDKSSTPSGAGHVQCAPGSTGCERSDELDKRKVAAAGHFRDENCAPDAQSCDERTKAKRERADAEARDRHACRD